MTTRLAVILGACGLALAPTLAPGQDLHSAPAVERLVTLMRDAGLQSFATKLDGGPDLYVSAMLFPDVQLLVVLGRHQAPGAIDAKIAAKDYQGAYADHNGSTIREGKLFVMDMQADGLAARPSSGAAFDIAYEDGERETRFDGDWKKQKLSQADYKTRIASIDDRYTKAVEQLIAALSASR
ncbi:MAG: hypothetical protein AB7O93_04290 [Vicinamibacterales bacterium]